MQTLQMPSWQCDIIHEHEQVSIQDMFTDNSTNHCVMNMKTKLIIVCIIIYTESKHVVMMHAVMIGSHTC